MAIGWPEIVMSGSEMVTTTIKRASQNKVVLVHLLVHRLTISDHPTGLRVSFVF